MLKNLIQCLGVFSYENMLSDGLFWYTTRALDCKLSLMPGAENRFSLFCEAQAYSCAKMSSSCLKVGDPQSPAGAIRDADRDFWQKKLR